MTEPRRESWRPLAALVYLVVAIGFAVVCFWEVRNECRGEVVWPSAAMAILFLVAACGALVHRTKDYLLRIVHWVIELFPFS